ncbi:MAG: hypothetical protein JWO50_546 [Candidatus Kaiserbacteria bacterium]|nr:hypothetical protein [Candidatus Kaiserbacteria bacterium]
MCWKRDLVTNIFCAVAQKISRPQLAVSSADSTSLRFSSLSRTVPEHGTFLPSTHFVRLCWKRDLNSHGLPHMLLRHARIPIPPFQHSRVLYTKYRTIKIYTQASTGKLPRMCDILYRLLVITEILCYTASTKPPEPHPGFFWCVIEVYYSV